MDCIKSLAYIVEGTQCNLTHPLLSASLTNIIYAAIEDAVTILFSDGKLPFSAPHVLSFPDILLYLILLSSSSWCLPRCLVSLFL
jgi:hypothetical protein